MKKSTNEILLGYSVPQGKESFIPLRHMAVFGQTQEAGKTTALEGLIHRSQRTAIAFITKRGESGFDNARTIPPFFRERADWEFVESILESAMRQRMRFERAWIVRACEGANTLADVSANLERLQTKAKRSMDADMYMLLSQYLKKVLPLIESLPRGMTVDLYPGALNVMDLHRFPVEMQYLIIASVLNEIHQHREEVITIVPEAWKFIPQGRKTPVKLEVEKLAREGAAIGNFVWLDSQDIAGVDKVILRAMHVILLGVQQETHEVKRALSSLPAEIRKPKPQDVRSLRLGEFYACVGNSATCAYALPAWGKSDIAQNIAREKDSVLRGRLLRIQNENRGQPKSDHFDLLAPKTRRVMPIGLDHSVTASVGNKAVQTIATTGEDAMERELFEKTIKGLNEISAKLDRIFAQQTQLQTLREFGAVQNSKPHADEGRAGADGLTYAEIKDRLLREIPALFQLMQAGPVLEVITSPVVITYDDKSLKGRIVRLLAEGFFDKPVIGMDVVRALKRVGVKTAIPNVYSALNDLSRQGAFIIDGKSFERASGLTIRKVEAK